MSVISDSAALKKLESAAPFKSLTNLPHYGFLFFFRNLKPFTTEFVVLTTISIISSLLSYTAVWQVSEVISRLGDITQEQLLGHYLPLILGSLLAMECIDYFLRRDAEVFPAVYCDFLTLRFYKTFLQFNSRKILNISKERLQILVNRYINGVNQFLGDWFWGTSRKIVTFVIVFVILYRQSPAVFLFDSLLFAILVYISVKISSRLSVIARENTEQVIASSSTIWSFIMNLNAVRRLGIYEFFVEQFRRNTAKSWQKLGAVKKFHASRWLVQLNMYQCIYVGTLIYGAYQVKIGQLGLGYLVLIKYAFDKLWDIFVFISEYYVALIQQRQDAEVVNLEFKNIFGDSQPCTASPIFAQDWHQLSLNNVALSFMPAGQGDREVNISVPELNIQRGDKIGIIGPSGVGKTTVLAVLQNLIDFRGTYKINDHKLTDEDIPASFMTIINNTDYLFNISIGENIKLGREVDSEVLQEVLTGVGAQEFLTNFEAQVGSPGFNLSAGQLQRVRLARGLLQQSSIYLLDEPFNGIDQSTKSSIITYLRAKWDRATVVLVTHDRSELALVDKVYEFRGCSLVPAAA